MPLGTGVKDFLFLLILFAATAYAGILWQLEPEPPWFPHPCWTLTSFRSMVPNWDGL